MALKPILFNTDMVRAILDGRKTVTRRVVKGIPSEYSFCGMEMNPAKIAVHADGEMYPKTVEGLYANFEGEYSDNFGFPMVKAPYQPGDILWVRETWAWISDFFEVDPAVGIPDGYIYRADYKEAGWADMIEPEYLKWRPSIHMDCCAARIFLRVTDVRVEKLQDITESGERSAKAEGFMNDVDLTNGVGKSATKHFSEFWDSTIKTKDRALYGWDANPWVFVIGFERISEQE